MTQLKSAALVAFTLGFVVTAAPARGAEEKAIERVLVMDVVAQGADPALNGALSDAFSYAVRQALPEAAVLGQADLRTVLAAEAQAQLLGCEAAGCLTEIGGAMGADHLAVANVGKVGEVWVLTFKLLRVSEGKMVRLLHEELEGDQDVERLLEAVRQLGASLVDPLRPAGLGRLTIGGTGQVSVDGRLQGEAPVTVYVSPGSHEVSWFRRDTWSAPKPVVAAAYARVRVEGEGRDQLRPEHPDLESDLGPVIVLAGIGIGGSGQSEEGPLRDEITGVNTWLKLGWAFEDNLHLYARCMLYEGSAESASGASLGAAYGGACAGGGAFDVGAQTHFSVFAGLGPMWQGGDRIHNGVAAGLQFGMDFGYALTRYLGIGLSMDLHVPLDDRMLPMLGFGLNAGIPSERLTGLRPRDWRTDPAFWISAATFAVAAGFTAYAGYGQAMR